MKNLIDIVMATNSREVDTTKLAKQLFAVYTDEPEEKVIKKKQFAPSSIGNGHGACARYWNYAFKGTNSFKKHSIRGLSSLQSGTDRHTQLQTLLDKAGLLEASEVKISSDSPPIGGYVDALINFDNKQIVVEIKTINVNGFEKLPIQGPVGHHLIQLLLYMHFLEKENGLLWYENKNTGEWHWVNVLMTEKNKKYVKSIIEWLQEVWQASSFLDELPKRQYKKSSPNCKYCPFIQTCWEERADKGTITMQEFPML